METEEIISVITDELLQSIRCMGEKNVPGKMKLQLTLSSKQENNLQTLHFSKCKKSKVYPID